MIRRPICAAGVLKCDCGGASTYELMFFCAIPYFGFAGFRPRPPPLTLRPLSGEKGGLLQERFTVVELKPTNLRSVLAAVISSWTFSTVPFIFMFLTRMRLLANVFFMF